MTNAVDRRDGLTGDLAVKTPVRCATTANISLTGLQTIDGVTVVEGDRVLVKNQTDAADNGIYNASSGAWVRAKDFDGSRDIIEGSGVFVIRGSTLAQTFWHLTTESPTIDADDLTFERWQIPSDKPGDVTKAGAIGDGSTNDRAAIASADTDNDVSGLYFPAGTYRISSNITIENDCEFAPGAKLSVDSGVTVTFWGNVTGSPTKQIFAGLGSVRLGRASTGVSQRTPVYLEWWGGAGDYGVTNTDNYAPLQKAHDALLSGGVIQLNSGWYYLTSGVEFTNCIHLVGWGNGHNSEVGGSVLTPSTTFSRNGGVLLDCAVGSANWRNFMVLGPDPSDPLMNYTAIKYSDGSGKNSLDNIEILGAGIGLNYEAGNTLNLINPKIYQCTVRSISLGGVAEKFEGPLRSFGGIINNPNTTGVTNGVTVAPSRVLTVDVPALDVPPAVGNGISGYGIPAGTKIASFTTTTITLDTNTSANIASGQSFRYGVFLQGVGIYAGCNAFDNNFKDLEIAGGYIMVQVEGETEVTTAGIRKLLPNNFILDNGNLTASSYYGIVLTRCREFQFINSWCGDVPFGPGMLVNPPSTDEVSGVTLMNSLVGSSGTYNVACLDGKGFHFVGNKFPGASLVGSGGFPSVYFGPNCEGPLVFTDNIADSQEINHVSSGLQSYGLHLDTASFSGANDNVVIVGNSFDGTVGGLLDSSAPTVASGRKVIRSNVNVLNESIAGAFTSLSATGGIGYGTGAGGTVPQATNKGTAVSLNKVCGTITTNNAALAANTAVTFTFNNTAIDAGDLVAATYSAPTAGAYSVNINVTGDNTATVELRNLTAGSLSEAVVIKFAIIKAVAA